MLRSKQDTYTLINGVKIPCMGYGTYKTESNEEGLQAIKTAIEVGYRHIDTAQGYKNEHLVGQAIKESGIPREDFFITSKLWNDHQGYASTLQAFEQTCEQLQSDYVDLFLIHWPIPIGHNEDWKTRNQETWRAFEKLYQEGRIKAIGVSNFLEHHLANLMETASIAPMVNQLEFHPKYQQREIVAYCQTHDILVESWGPLMRGKAFSEPALIQMAEESGHSIAQLLLRWCMEKQVLPLAKSMKKERMIDNADIFDFTLTKKQKRLLDGMNTEDCYVFHPDRNEEWFK